MSQTSEIEKIESVQIIRIEETEFVFDYDAVKQIIDSNPECADLPVAILIINGALRTGKSFFNNFVIRHLLKLSNDGTDKGGDLDNMLADYFRSRRGPDIQTLGIWALNKIFVQDGKAIILMDTQGIFDRELNQAMTTALICLSTLMSSYQIYNLDKRIQEDHLNNMAYFSAYTDLMDGLNENSSKDSDDSNVKIGQTLSLLVRDWQNFEDNLDLENCIKETEKYQEEFLSDNHSKDPVKRNTRNKIMNTYDKVNVRLCPHPGHVVTEGVFSGNLNDVREEFKLHMDYIISDILENIEAKRIPTNMELICSDVPKFMQRYVELYRDIKGSLPTPSTILETTSKISQTGAKTNTVSKYKQIMFNGVHDKLNPLDKEGIERLHVKAKGQAHRYFNSVCVMGEASEIRSIMKSIDDDIDAEYLQFQLMAVEKNFMFRVNQIIGFVFNYFIAIMSMDFQSLGLRLVVPLLMIVRYMIGFFLPTALYNVVDYIVGNVIWVLVGMLILQYMQEQPEPITHLNTPNHSDTELAKSNRPRKRAGRRK